LRVYNFPINKYDSYLSAKYWANLVISGGTRSVSSTFYSLAILQRTLPLQLMHGLAEGILSKYLDYHSQTPLRLMWVQVDCIVV